MKTKALLPAVLFLSVLGCRGWTSEKPPVHLIPNMDTQEKYKAFRASEFFEDGRAMRPIPEGTVARGHLNADDHLYQGTVSGQPATRFPAEFPMTDASMRRGHERYDIYCAPCHDRAGNGRGTVAARLAVKPPSFHDARLKEMSVGRIYQAIAHGVNPPNMPSYAAQIRPEDRWAITLYIRALQKAQDPSFNPGLSAAAGAPGTTAVPAPAGAAGAQAPSSNPPAQKTPAAPAAAAPAAPQPATP